MLTGCNEIFTNNDEDSTDKEQNYGDDEKDNPGTVKKVTFKTVDLSGTTTDALISSAYDLLD